MSLCKIRVIGGVSITKQDCEALFTNAARDSRAEGRWRHQSDSNNSLAFLDQRLDRMLGQWLQEKMGQDQNNNRGQGQRRW